MTNSACMKIPLHFSQTEMNSGLRVLENQEQIPPPRNQANTIWKTTGITSCLESFCEYSPPWVYQCASVLVLRTENSIQARRGELRGLSLKPADGQQRLSQLLQTPETHRNKKFLLQSQTHNHSQSKSDFIPLTSQFYFWCGRHNFLKSTKTSTNGNTKELEAFWIRSRIIIYE